MSRTDRSAESGPPPREWAALALILAGCLAVAAIGGAVTASSVDTWYPTLTKPSWNPPNSVFAPVWTLLYVMMGLAAWMVWNHRDRADIRAATVLFVAQLVLNTGWSVVFFGLRRPGFAFFEIVLLGLAIVATLLTFSRISRTAAWLLVPYLGWVSFAAVLNFAIWRLNA